MSRSRSRSPARSFENERNDTSYGGGGGGGMRGGGGGGGPRSDELFSIKVDNMSLRTNKEDVRAKFERFGEIGDIFFPSDKYTGSSRGFCFVRFFKEDAREDACDHYRDGFEMDDKQVRIEKASTRPRPGTDNWDPDKRRGQWREDGGRGGFRGGNRGGFEDRNRSFGDRFGDRRGPPPRSRAENMHSLKIMDMTLRTTKDDVREKFSKFGEIGDLFFPPDKDTGASRGFCYVRYFDRDQCDDALDEYRNGVELDGKTCLLEKANPRGGGGGRGGFGGGRGGGFGGGGGRFGGGGRDRFDDRRLDRFDERDRRDDRGGFGGRDRERDRSPGYGRSRRSPSPRRRDSPVRRRRDSRSPPAQRRAGRDSRSPPRRQRSPDYDRYRRRSPLARSRSRSPYRR